jgi:hypothetical protein
VKRENIFSLTSKAGNTFSTECFVHFAPRDLVFKFQLRVQVVKILACCVLLLGALVGMASLLSSRALSSLKQAGAIPSVFSRQCRHGSLPFLPCADRSTSQSSMTQRSNRESLASGVKCNPSKNQTLNAAGFARRIQSAEESPTATGCRSRVGCRAMSADAAGQFFVLLHVCAGFGASKRTVL